MKKVLTISILAVMVVLMMVTGVNATTNSNLADTLYNMASGYGMTSADKVKIQRYLADHPVTDEQANSVVAQAGDAIKVMDNAGVKNYKDLSKDQKAQVRSIANNAASVVGVELSFKSGSVEVIKDGKVIETISADSNGKLAYTGNNNIVLVVSSIAVIALASVAVARKNLANA